MTTRIQRYREQKQQQGLMQVRVWVPREHGPFIKNIAKECRPSIPPKVPERYGRRATAAQIRIAKALATINGKAPPEHLYDYHVSLAAWMWAHGGGPFK